MTKMEEDSSDSITVHSFCKSTPTSPCLVSFEYGSLGKDEATKLQCNLFVSKKHNKQTMLVSKKNQYYKGKINSKSLCKTLLLVRNRKTNKARLIAASTCMLESYLRERNQQKLSISDIDTSTNNTLSQVFGSKKAKRISDMGMRMKVNTSVLQEDVKKIISDINIKGKDIPDVKSSSEDTITQLLPNCNRDAEHVSEVYKVEDLLTETELNSLDKAVALLNEDKEKKSEFLETHLNQLGSNPPADKVKLLIVADSLLRFVNMGAIEIKNKSCLRNICPSSRVIGTKILNEFTVLTGNTRNRPVSYKDKAVCYIMILVLLSCYYKMNLDFISSVMKGYHQKKLLQLCKTVGVVAATEAGQKVYVLRVPLPKLPTLAHKKKQGNY
ncbi:hypothetical protein O3M35_008591 [Rhynocoris fuscipes]|uniref:DNA-directed RNA polymerase I subunit RPA49 n=1 Tax=Rhynocoris fuscipes TaxID=488301 RepID=A0AAW1D6R6_9HEMI